MRKLWFVLLILIMSFNTYGQAPVTDTSWLPSEGDKFYIYRIGYTQFTSPIIEVKDTGENISWNYNEKHFNLYAPDDSLFFTTPESIYVTPYNSEVNFAEGDSQNYTFYIKNEKGLFVTESKSTNDFGNPFNHNIDLDPYTLFKTNLAFRDSFYDTSMYAGFMHYDYSDTSYRGYSTSVVKYDSYGTLKVAGAEYKNVIRTFSRRYIKFVSNNIPDTSYSYVENYNWQNSEFKENLLSYFLVYEIKKADNNYDTSFLQAGLSLWLPTRLYNAYNPNKTTSDVVKVYFEGNKINFISYKDIGSTHYALYDVRGRLLNKGKIQLNYMERTDFTTTSLPSSVYTLILQGENGYYESFKLSK